MQAKKAQIRVIVQTKSKTVSYNWQEYILCAICYIKISNSITYKCSSRNSPDVRTINLELLNSSLINATDANSQLNICNITSNNRLMHEDFQRFWVNVVADLNLTKNQDFKINYYSPYLAVLACLPENIETRKADQRESLPILTFIFQPLSVVKGIVPQVSYL